MPYDIFRGLFDSPVQQSQTRSVGIGPSDLLRGELKPELAPSHQPTQPEPYMVRANKEKPLDPSPTAYDFMKGLGQGAVNAGIGLGNAYMNYTNPNTYALQKGFFDDTDLAQWAQPQNKDQFVGSLWGDALVPGPGELATAGKYGLKALSGLSAGIGSLDDVAEKMGKPSGSFTSKWFTRTRDNNPEVQIFDKLSEGGSPNTRPVGYITFHPDPVDDHLLVDVTHSDDDYADKGFGFGTEMYKTALGYAQDEGYTGIASKPWLRNKYSKEIWDRPGIERKEIRGQPIDFMQEYIPRGRDWEASGLKDLFASDKGPQPILSGIKEDLMNQMKNRSLKSYVPPQEPMPPRTDYISRAAEADRQIEAERLRLEQNPFLQGIDPNMMKRPLIIRY